MDRFSKWIKAAGLDKKSHQERGMRWVLERETAPTIGSKGGFVCDEMGLGKTIQTIAFVGALMHEKQFRNSRQFNPPAAGKCNFSIPSPILFFL